jgi:hypothetical protein
MKTPKIRPEIKLRPPAIIKGFQDIYFMKIPAVLQSIAQTAIIIIALFFSLGVDIGFGSFHLAI